MMKRFFMAGYPGAVFPGRRGGIGLSRTALLVVGLCWVSLAAGQTCNPQMRHTTPYRQFKTSEDGNLVFDRKTGLTWRRCLLGMQWDGVACAGPLKTYTWQQALAASQASTEHGFQDWRLPNVKELKSLVERACSSPAINTRLFYGDPAGWIWTATPDANSPENAWFVDFNYGYDVTNFKSFSYGVRLVRSGPER